MLVGTIPGTAGFNVAGSSGGPATSVQKTQVFRIVIVLRCLAKICSGFSNIDHMLYRGSSFNLRGEMVSTRGDIFLEARQDLLTWTRQLQALKKRTQLSGWIKLHPGLGGSNGACVRSQKDAIPWVPTSFQLIKIITLLR